MLNGIRVLLKCSGDRVVKHVTSVFVACACALVCVLCASNLPFARLVQDPRIWIMPCPKQSLAHCPHAVPKGLEVDKVRAYTFSRGLSPCAQRQTQYLVPANKTHTHT